MKLSANLILYILQILDDLHVSGLPTPDHEVDHVSTVHTDLTVDIFHGLGKEKRNGMI